MMEDHLEGAKKGRPSNIVFEPVPLGKLHNGTVYNKSDYFSQALEVLLAVGLVGTSLIILMACDHTSNVMTFGALIALQSALMTQLVMQFHDGLHFAIFRRARLNTALSRVIGSYCLWPTTFLRESHLQHHRRAGLVEDDPEVLHFSPEFIERNRWAGLLNRLAQTSWAPLLFTPLLQAVHFTRYFRQTVLVKRNPAALRAYIVEVSMMFASWAVISHFLKTPIVSFLAGHFVPSLIAMSLVYWAAKPLHTQMMGAPLPELDSTSRTLSIARSFESNRLVRLFFANLGFHIEHHLQPSVSRWNLPRLAASLRPQLEKFANEQQLPFAYHRSYRRWYQHIGSKLPTHNAIRTLDEWKIQNPSNV